MIKVDELKELGFEKAATNVIESQDLLRRTAIAYEHYDYITPEDVKVFNDKLRAKTVKDSNGYATYDNLVFHSVRDYPEVPPTDVLEKLREAKARNCFDTFEIAKIESVKEVKDPILFGKIKDCGDMFFIAQWDDDVTIEAIKEASGKV